MKFTKVITHDGLFHADEVLAIALLMYFNHISFDSVERRKRDSITSEEKENPKILLLDVGMEYNPEKGNFDHHQDKDLEATNLLVLRHFLYDQPELMEKLFYSLFSYVSDIDRGIKSKVGESAGFNAVVKNFNVDKSKGFENAVVIVEKILQQYILNAEVSIKSEKAWSGFERQNDGKIVIMKKGDPFVSDWKRIGKDEGVQFLIVPNEKEEGLYNLISRDTDIVKIKEHPNQTFLHNSEFFAIYDSFESVINHAKQLCA